MPSGEYKIGREAYTKSYRLANRDKVRAHNKRWREQNKAEAKAAVKRSMYGISREEYERWMQIVTCEICGNSPSSGDQCLSMDHNHTTGKVRGMLCRKCNSALGLASDDPVLLKKMVLYLEKRNA